ncbi:MAG: FMN-binding protein [Candidatus Omnitrophota bacterium]|nr:MAG: FMN-binding protein [Candidatus Omnitrophota bacterium]
MRKPILLLFFALGFFSLLAQTLILREFIISFGGNELGIGAFYFFWLLWVGIGALVTLTVLRKFIFERFFTLLALYPILAFIELFICINLRSVAGVSWWEFFSFERVFLYLFFLTSFISFFTGIIFTLDALWLKKIKEDSTASVISASYIFEALGSFIAGCLVTFLIANLAHPMLILHLGSIFFSFVASWASIRVKKTSSTWANAILLGVLIIFSFSPQKLVNFSQGLRMKNLLPQGKLVREVYTHYQHIILSELPNQTVLLSNGEIMSSYPEVVDADREAALFFAQADKPERILVFGYGVENTIKSLLKFPVKEITYIIKDRVYYEYVHQNLPSELRWALKDRRLKIIVGAPRQFLKDNKGEFDLALVYTSDPTNLVINSFFTREFYSLLEQNLTDRGVLATRITSAENFLGEEIRNYGSSLYYTLKDVFSEIVIVPGKTNWVFAGDKQSSVTEQPQVLETRVKKFLTRDFSFYPEVFRSMFLARRVSFVKEMYRDNPLFQKIKLINQDDQPLTFFLNLLVLARYSNSYLVHFFKSAQLVGVSIFLIPLIIFICLRFLFLLKIENTTIRRVVFNAKLYQFFSGFLGFSFHLLLIFLFQNRFGTIFQLIGLVNALFMLGLCAGGFGGRFLMKKGEVTTKIIGILFFQALLIMVTYPIFIYSNLAPSMVFAFFVVFFFLSGMITGSSYPLAAKVLEDNQVSLRTTAAHLELLDHWGGSLAGLLVGLFMLPLVGVRNTFFIIIVIVSLLLIIFVLERVPLTMLRRERTPKLLSFPYIRTSYVLAAIALICVIDLSLIEQKREIWKAPVAKRLEVEEDCFWQESPFKAYVCETEEGKEFVVSSEDFAPDVKGFGGPINLRLKVNDQGKILEAEVLKHQETSAYVGDFSELLQQFKGRFVGERFSLDTIDAVSGATITSRAVAAIMDEVSQKIKKGLEGVEIEPTAKRKIIVDEAGIALIIFTVVALILYCLPYNPVIRKIYLFLVVLVLGIRYNLIFSFFHLGNLIMLKFFSLGIISQILIYCIPLILGIFLGQAWCGWLCPFGALQELFGGTGKHLTISEDLAKKARYIKYLFLVFFIFVVSWKRDTLIFSQEPLSTFFLRIPLLSFEKFLSLVVLFFSLFFLRFWCQYFCVCGAFLSLFNKIAIFKRFFIKRYRKCEIGAKGYYDLSCLRCNLCMKKDEQG